MVYKVIYNKNNQLSFFTLLRDTSIQSVFFELIEPYMITTNIEDITKSSF